MFAALVTTLAGSTTSGWTDGIGSVAKFNQPYSVSIDAVTGMLYVTDSYNDEIKDNCQIMVELILECQKEGIIFLINTARSEYQLQKAKEQVEELGIVVHGINKMHEGWDKPYGLNGKLYANIFLDDRGGFWDSYWTLSNALTIIKQNRNK